MRAIHFLLLLLFQLLAVGCNNPPPAAPTTEPATATPTATAHPTPTQVTMTDTPAPATAPPMVMTTPTPPPHLIDWSAIVLPTIAITMPVSIVLAPGVALSDTAQLNLTLGINADGQVYGSAEVADAPIVSAAPAPTAMSIPLAVCSRIVKKERNGKQLSLCADRPERTITAADIGYWFGEVGIAPGLLTDAARIADCESGSQWTHFLIDGNGNRGVGPFSIVWRFFAAPAAEHYGRALDPTNDEDYFLMLKYLLDRNGWSIWACADALGVVVERSTPTPSPTLASVSADCLSIGTNLWFLAEWGERAFDASGDFSAEYIESLHPYAVIRVHDWINTNTNLEVEWRDRRTDGGYVGVDEQGAQWETIIELANQAARDVWITTPTLASDDYFDELAQLFAAELDPTLAVYVEYSNETWNTVFMPFEHVEASGGATFQAARSAALWDAFSAELPPQRVQKVIAIRNGDAARLEQLLATLAPDVVAVNAYVGDGHAFDPQTADSVWAAGLADEVRKMQNVAAMVPSGVALVAYEGGQHWNENAVEFSKWAGSADLYQQMLTAFSPYLDLFIHYTHSGEQWGARGSAEFKYQILSDWRSQC